MNCLIVDDNVMALSIIKKLIGMTSELQIIGECYDAVQAYEQLQTTNIDLLFLDIEMPDMSGIELVRSLGERRPMVIFTTSTMGYAAEAFDLNVVDFLIKPVSAPRFLIAVEKAKRMSLVKGLGQTDKEDEFVFIRDSNIVRRLRINDILFMEAKGDYVRISSVNGDYSIHSSLKSVEEKLSKNIFLRVHRSFIINVSKIDTIEGGTLIVNHKIVPVSDAYRAGLYKRMQIL